MCKLLSDSLVAIPHRRWRLTLNASMENTEQHQDAHPPPPDGPFQDLDAEAPRVNLPGTGGVIAATWSDVVKNKFASVGAACRRAWAPVGGIPLARVFRFRPRGRVTRLIESRSRAEMLRTMPGGKTSAEFNAADWFREVIGRGGKVVGNHQVWSEGTLDDPVKLLDVMLSIRLDTGDVVEVSVGMLSSLVSYVTFRPRTQELLMALRSRAVQVSKEMDVTSEYTTLVLAGTVAFAHLVTNTETKAWSILGGVQGKRSAKMSTAFETGVVPPIGVVWPVVLAFVLISGAYWSSGYWLGQYPGWFTEGWGARGSYHTVQHTLLAWRAARRISAPFGFTLRHRGADPLLVLAAALWAVLGAAIIGWAYKPEELREKSRVFGRSGRKLSKAGK